MLKLKPIIVGPLVAFLPGRFSLPLTTMAHLAGGILLFTAISFAVARLKQKGQRK